MRIALPLIFIRKLLLNCVYCSGAAAADDDKGNTLIGGTELNIAYLKRTT